MSIQRAIEILTNKGLVGIPTETVYGLAADATSDEAVSRIYALKSRPKVNPLIIHVFSKEEAKQHVKWTQKAEILADHFWPGPLTIVLPLRENSPLSLLVTAGLSTVAVRVPNHKVTLDLLKNFNKPLAAPSANPSMSISPTSSEDVKEAFGSSLELVLEGGPCNVGIESTIVDLSEDKPYLLRLGGVSKNDLEKVLNEDVFFPTHTLIKAPGMMKRHYAPQKPLRLNALGCLENEALLGFGPTHLPVSLNLSETGDLNEAASNLFRMLRVLDKLPVLSLAVMPIPGEGIGQAINDRLERAACRLEK